MNLNDSTIGCVHKILATTDDIKVKIDSQNFLLKGEALIRGRRLLKLNVV